MFDRFGRVLCQSCGKAMRLSTIVPGEMPGEMQVTFQCNKCERTREVVCEGRKTQRVA